LGALFVNGLNKYSNDMKEKIESIALQYSLTDSEASQLANELLNLFDVFDSEKVTISKKEYDWLKKCEEDLNGISFSL